MTCCFYQTMQLLELKIASLKKFKTINNNFVSLFLISLKVYDTVHSAYPKFYLIKTIFGPRKVVPQISNLGRLLLWPIYSVILKDK